MVAFVAGGTGNNQPRLVPAEECNPTRTCIPDLEGFIDKYDGLLEVEYTGTSAHPVAYGERDGDVSIEERIEVYMVARHPLYPHCMDTDSDFFPTIECKSIREKRADMVLNHFLPYDVTGDRKISEKDDLEPDNVISAEDANEARL